MNHEKILDSISQLRDLCHGEADDSQTSQNLLSKVDVLLDELEVTFHDYQYNRYAFRGGLAANQGKVVSPKSVEPWD